MTYQIHRYPAELIDVVRLPGERRLTIRPVLPQDADLVQAFVRELSDGSRRNRFFRTLRELPQPLLEQFTCVNYRDTLALVAEIFDGDAETLVGDARYVVDGDGQSAELALAVRDEWQHQGVGQLLLVRLIARATAQGLARLHGQVLPSNRAMLSLAHRLGFTVTIDRDEPGLQCIEIQLTHGTAAYAASYAA
jgi:acetyltransferase